ncbi:acetate/propionate family kinase [Methylobacterium currus]|uniref:Acetate kinase n=1 Tax=Methylobacterium currus TaxID=2051553 RepID=A0A2R4WWI4_9HYPH|nr:acetate/propionate family kinase [Methylobacterium currus]AWB25875.1 acetate/propionate family kinase [Methylobacterium currus]UHC19516.1 acetate/propionate family kinase [Methylobacterium currus]
MTGPHPTDAILAINAGSSSLKFALAAAGTLAPLCRGGISGLGGAVKLETSGPLALAGADPPAPGCDHAGAVAWLLGALRRVPGLVVRAAGHRVVHGGRDFSAPLRVDDEVLARLEQLVPLAPAHQPLNLAGIRAVAEAWPGLPQIACFDTAFHRTQPRLAQLFPIPRALGDEGLLRYGFHGLSYEHVASVLPEVAGPRADGRVIVAHLGHGASLCALRNRRSVASTMGLTALDGLMMGTRSGSVDPGLVLHLIRERGLSPDAVADLLNARSGLLGVSGISDDVRVLQDSDDPRAAEALDLFVYRAVREAGSLVAALGGLDALVFTAGIGEHAPRIRAAIAAGLAVFGVALDPARNDRGDTCISRVGSRVAVYVVPANEELPIARAVVRCLAEAVSRG